MHEPLKLHKVFNLLELQDSELLFQVMYLCVLRISQNKLQVFP